MRPLDLLSLNLGHTLDILIKRNHRYIGKLTGFDEHLNLFLEGTRCIYYKEDLSKEPTESNDEFDDDDDFFEVPYVKHEEELGDIMLRGDNVIFMKIERPNFTPPRSSGGGRYKDSRQGGGGGGGGGYHGGRNRNSGRNYDRRR